MRSCSPQPNLDNLGKVIGIKLKWRVAHHVPGIWEDGQHTLCTNGMGVTRILSLSLSPSYAVMQWLALDVCVPYTVCVDRLLVVSSGNAVLRSLCALYEYSNQFVEAERPKLQVVRALLEPL